MKGGLGASLRQGAGFSEKINLKELLIMLMPSIFTGDLFDDFFEPRYYARNNTNLMKTDVRETEQGYELYVDLPGVKKDELKAELKNGYLTVSATTNQNNDQKDENGKYIRRERYSGTFSRNFYVGENITQDEIKAKFENGTLILNVPKKEQSQVSDERKYISIE